MARRLAFELPPGLVTSGRRLGLELPVGLASLCRRFGLGLALGLALAACSEETKRPGAGVPAPAGQGGGGQGGQGEGGQAGAAGGAGGASAGQGGGGQGGAGGAGGEADGYVTLFGGALTSEWRMSTIVNQPGRDDPGRFEVQDGALVSFAGTDLGLLWHATPTPPDFELALEFRLSAPDDNSGVFVRFPHPDSRGYDNTAWVAINFGFEVQIDETGRPDGAPQHTTGAIYDEPGQAFTRVAARPPGEWNDYLIRAEGQAYTVRLNGQQVTRFDNPHADRGLPSAPAAPSFIGLQTHSGNVAFRNIRIRALP
jgi:hypothetical protein